MTIDAGNRMFTMGQDTIGVFGFTCLGGACKKWPIKITLEDVPSGDREDVTPMITVYDIELEFVT